jgi:hypothetical protein
MIHTLLTDVLLTVWKMFISKVGYKIIVRQNTANRNVKIREGIRRKRRTKLIIEKNTSLVPDGSNKANPEHSERERI